MDLQGVELNAWEDHLAGKILDYLPDSEIAALASNERDRREWLIGRSKGVGGSDIGKIAGLSSYGNALSTYLSKIDPLSEMELATGESAQIGIDLEGYVAKKFEGRTGYLTIPVPYILRSKKHPFALASIDRLVVDQSTGKIIGVLECKTSGIKTDWGTDEEPKIPDVYLVQGQWYLGVTGLQKIWFCALCGGYGGLQILVREETRDEELIENLFATGRQFWDMVESRTIPALDGSDISSDILDRMYPFGTEEGKALDLPGADLLAAAYINAKDAAKAAEAEKKRIANEIKSLLGEHQMGLTPHWKLSWTNVFSERIDTEALRAQEPLIAQRFTVPSPSRRINVSPRKENKK